LRSVPPGAVVALAPGRYPPLTIDRRTRPRGAVTFRAAGRRRPTVAKVTVAGVRRVAIERLRLPGGLAVLSASGVRVRGNDLPGHGIYVRTSDGVEILRNRIHDLEGAKRGLLAQGFADGRRKGNRRIVVRGNRFERLQHDAIAFYNGYDRARVQGNTISDVVQPAGFPLHSDAMQFMGGKRLVLRDNVVRDSTHGILVKDGTTTGLAVSGNLVFGIDGAGLQVFNGPGTRIRRNTIWDVKDGVLLQNDARVAGRTTAVLEDNVLEQLIVAPDARIPRARGNLFGRGRTFGAPSYQGTPRFRDAEEGDYRLAGDPGAGIPAGEEPGADRRAR
jgi:nitrous oxidase accessory protein NosD